MTRRNRYSTEFGASVSKELAEARLSQSELAAKTGLSASHLNQMMTGRKRAAPEWVDIIASTLKLQEPDRKRLHRAAAKDAGYDIDLTKK
jgi:transcriptional regulator with XRE-family HTH domain